MKACTVEVSPHAIHPIACSAQLQDDGETNWVTAFTDDPSVLTLDSVPMQKPTTPQIHQLDIATAQRQDKAIGPVMAYLKSGKRPASKQTEKDRPATKQLLYDWRKLKIGTDGILRWMTGSYKQIVLPTCFHRLVYRELRDEMGHLGAEKVTNLARQHFFWPKMQSDIELFVGNVCQCKQKAPAVKTRAPLQPITTSSPFELVAIDFVHLEKSSGGYEYILVIVHHFTHYGQAYATRNKSAKTAAGKLYNDFILWFGFPTKIHHDQGGEFENNLFARLQQLFDIKHSRTTPYHPQINGQVERFNCTLLSMLCTLPETYKSNWKDYLNKVVHAYNFTRNDSTAYSPFILLFGHHSRLPIDLLFNINPSLPHQSYPQYVSAWKSAMEEGLLLSCEKVTE